MVCAVFGMHSFVYTDAAAQFVKALRYKTEGHGFNSR